MGLLLILLFNYSSFIFSQELKSQKLKFIGTQELEDIEEIDQENLQDNKDSDQDFEEDLVDEENIDNNDKYIRDEKQEKELDVDDEFDESDQNEDDEEVGIDDESDEYINLEEDFLDLDQEEDEQDNYSIEQKNQIKKESEQKISEFNNFISKYYPKVFLICEKFFCFMTPEDIAKGLQDITNMIALNPYLYFEFLFKQIENKLTEQEKIEWKKNNFSLDNLKSIFNNRSLNKWLKSGGGYCELVANQLAYYNYFIEYCYVDLKDNSVDLYVPEDYDFSFLYGIEKKDSNKIRLRDYWIKNGITSVYDFYALSFDYWVKLFLNTILEKNYMKASSYLFDLKLIVERLTGSVYESERRENLKTYQELFDILKQEIKLKTNKPAGKEDKYMQEFSELWDF